MIDIILCFHIMQNFYFIDFQLYSNKLVTRVHLHNVERGPMR